jgi:hypothetical protein
MAEAAGGGRRDDFDLEREAFAAALTPRPAPGRGKTLIRRVRQNLGVRVKAGAISAAVGYGVGWLANVWVMARKYDGYVVPSGSAATGEGNLVRGSLFWFVIAAVVSAVVNYRLLVGRERFWQEVRGFPATIRRVVRTDGDTALVHVLWGFAGAVIVTMLLGPALSGAVAVGLLVSMATVLRPFVTGTLMTGWRWALRHFATHSRPGADTGAAARPGGHGVYAPSVALTVGLLGSIAAMAFASLARENSTRLFFGVAAGVGAYVLSRRAAAAGGTAALIVGLAAGLGVAVADALIGAGAAFADDGGWRECGSSLSNWISCNGADKVRWLAMFGGGASGAGALVGPGLAGVAAGDGPPKPWTEMTPEEQDAAINDLIERWKLANPGYDPARLDRFRDGLRARSQQPGFMDGLSQFTRDFLSSYSEDLTSGRQAAGLWETAVGSWEGFTGTAGTAWEGLKGSPEFIVNLGAAYWDDVSSGEQLERMKSVLAMGDEYIRVAGEFYSMSAEEQAAAYEKYGKENVDKFMRTMRDFDQALQGQDPDQIRRAIGRMAGTAEFDALAGGLIDKGIKVARGGHLVDDLVPPIGPGRADILYGAEGTTLNADDLVKVGVDPKRAEALIEEMKRTGGEVWLKPGSEDAVAWRNEGAAGKPEWMKSKSGNVYDEYIGLGQQGDSGLVRYGVPDPPTKPTGMSEAQWQEILPDVDRQYSARLQEYHDMAGVMNKAQNGTIVVDGVEKPLTMTIDGVEQHVRIDWQGGGTLPNGQSFGDGVLYAITDDGRKIPVAGDVDIFTYKGPGSLDQALPGIQRADPGIVHQADTPNWQPTDPKLQQVKNDIVHGASTENPSGQNLIKITGDGISTVRWSPRK